MKRVTSILAVVVLTIGLFSCEAETSTAEEDQLYQNTEIQANDGKGNSSGSGGN